jgi:hypothetical protein
MGMGNHKHCSERDAGYRVSYFDNDHDITGPIKMVITTPATGSYWAGMDVVSHTTCHVAVTEDVTIGAAGTALTFRNRNRQGDHPDDCACLAEYGGTYTGGTEILTKVELRAETGAHMLLKQSTSYLITVTSKADNNYTSVLAWVWQGSGRE